MNPKAPQPLLTAAKPKSMLSAWLGSLGFWMLALVSLPVAFGLWASADGERDVSPYIHPNLSIADLAAGYEGGLSRPIFPETSLFLPFEWQIGLSIGLMVLMVVVAFVFPKARRFTMFLTVVVVLRHLLWRGFDTLGFETLWNGITGYTIFAAEVLAFFTLIIGYFQIWGLKQRQAEPLEGVPESQLPHVDVMVCTYNEPLNVLYRTIVGCNYLDYPNKTVYLCDDGNRAEMAQLAEHLGVQYISRPENKHAKAGNLNHAMQFSNGQLVMVLDADHVPCRNFLKETVGFFLRDQELAFVQTPQHFFTPDPFQRNLVSGDVINNEQDLFFHIIEAGNDYWGAAFFGGSGAMFRRDALQEIGGFATETITEDVHTGLRLHSAGWRSAFYNKDLSAGMAQDSFTDFVKQRIRWSRGMTQILFFDHPLLAKGLSFGQRICYFAGIWYFFHGIARVIFIMAPLAFLLFGLKPVDAGFLEIMVYYLPSFTCLVLGYAIITLGMRQSFWSEVYETAACFYMLRTNILTLLFPFNAKFKVTPKEGINEGLAFHWRIVLPQLIVGVLTLLGLGFAIIRGLYSPDYWGGIVTNAFWSGYNLILIIGAVFVAQERPQFRLSPRIQRSIRCEVRLLDGSIAVGHTVDISESGVSAVFDNPFPIAGTLHFKLLDWDIEQVSVIQVQAIRSQVDSKTGKINVGFRFVNRTPEEHQQLIRHMFSSDDAWNRVHHQRSPLVSLWSLVTTLLRIMGQKETPFRRRNIRMGASLSCVLNINGDNLVGVSDQISESGIAVLFDHPSGIQLGQSAELQIEWPNGEKMVLPVAIRRNLGAQGGQRLIGMEFSQISREQRLALARQLYPLQSGLIRVAPSEHRALSCQVSSNGSSFDGVTQQVSEMGAVIQLLGNTGSGPQKGDSVSVALQIRPQEAALTYPAQIQDVAGSGLLLVYFQHPDMQSIDALSAHLHEPKHIEPFETV